MVQRRTTHTLGFMGMMALVIGLSGPALAKNGPPKSNPGQPFAEILAQIGILNDKLDALQDDVDNLPDGLGPCEVPPVWGQTYATADRFVSVLGGAAFCDKATGLVWEASPYTGALRDWEHAVSHCTTRTVGGQHGFHLPLIEQLTSLLPLLADDLNNATGDGPFSGVVPHFYWSATEHAETPSDDAWGVFFNGGHVGGVYKYINEHNAWCVRGGQVYDVQQAR